MPDTRTETRSDARKLDRIRLLYAYGFGRQDSGQPCRAWLGTKLPFVINGLWNLPILRRAVGNYPSTNPGRLSSQNTLSRSSTDSESTVRFEIVRFQFGHPCLLPPWPPGHHLAVSPASLDPLTRQSSKDPPEPRLGRVGGVVTEPLPPQSRACTTDALGSSSDSFAH